MLPEAPLVFLRHPMVTRSAAWLCRLPANQLVVSRRPASSTVKPYRRNFSTKLDAIDLPLGLTSDKPVTQYLQARAESGFIGIYASDPYCYGSNTSASSYHERGISQSNYTVPILGRVKRQIRDIRRAQSLPTLEGDGFLEYIERRIQLWDTLTDGVKPTSYNRTIMRLGETLTKMAHRTYTNIRGLNSAFQNASIGIRRGIGLYRSLSEGSWKSGASNFQRRWDHSAPLVDEPGDIQSCIIGSNMKIAEIASILRRHCRKNLARLPSLRSCSTHPVSTGGFGDIYLGKLENGTPVAVKVARYSTNDTYLRKQSKHTAEELHTWAKCQHPNVLPLLGMIEFRDQIAMVSPWMKNGDLRSYLGQHPEVDRVRLCRDICDGLVYLHSMNIVHGDLKGANVLISDSGRAMINDFGNSLVEDKSIRFTATTRNTACSSRWAAPEILEGAAASYPADVFALGMTLLVRMVLLYIDIAIDNIAQEAITGEVPYRELEREQAVMATILFKRALPLRPTAYIPQNSAHGDLLWDLLTRCWDYEPSNRPHAEEVQSLMAQITKTGLMQQPQHI